MIIYNITTKVHYSIDQQWLGWQQEIFIPAMMATGFFSSHRFLRLLDQDDSEGNTYAVQYTVDNQEQYNQFMLQQATALRGMAAAAWGERVISFHSALEVIQ